MVNEESGPFQDVVREGAESLLLESSRDSPFRIHGKIDRADGVNNSDGIGLAALTCSLRWRFATVHGVDAAVSCNGCSILGRLRSVQRRLLGDLSKLAFAF
jgi:hypothetical protein